MDVLGSRVAKSHFQLLGVLTYELFRVKHEETATICVAMPGPVCDYGLLRNSSFSFRPFLDSPRTVLVSLLAMW